MGFVKKSRRIDRDLTLISKVGSRSIASIEFRPDGQPSHEKFIQLILQRANQLSIHVSYWRSWRSISSGRGQDREFYRVINELNECLCAFHHGRSKLLAPDDTAYVEMVADKDLCPVMLVSTYSTGTETTKEPVAR